MVCALCLVNSVLTAAITKAKVAPRGTGTLLGLNMAAHSAIRTAAPSLGGALVAYGGLSAIGYLGVLCHIAALPLIKRTHFGGGKKELVE